jgi:DNA-binding response OmpR family regulator
MSGPSKVIVLDPDARAGRQLQLGFGREGVPAEVAPLPEDLADLALPRAGEAGLLVIGGTDGRALDLLRQARRAVGPQGAAPPIVFAGRGVRRTDAEAAGADEVVLPPAYLRDVVTIGRLLRATAPAERGHLVGSLAETTTVLTLVRALAALGRSAVLTLVRGLRRGEVRFYHGEVTSARVGAIHGQAALHQLLLWTDARFEFRHEEVVRRQQIPLTPEELIADAERFLSGIRASSGALSPSHVLEQDAARIQSVARQIPTEVHSVLRMFDGHRVLADVLEDSPYRVFETLRVTQLAVTAGLLRQAAAPRPRTTWRAVLPVEEWLAGAPPRDDDGPERTDRADGGDGEASGPVPRTATDAPSGATAGRGKARKRRRKRRATTPAAGGARPASAAPAGPIDWGSLVPRVLGAEVGPLACVVPAEIAAGELTTADPAASAARDAGGEPPTAARGDDGTAAATAPAPAHDDGAAPAPARDDGAAPALAHDDGAASAPAHDAAPAAAAPAPAHEVTDDPSDGVIREALASADTAPASRRLSDPTPVLLDDRPSDTTGEIVAVAEPAGLAPRDPSEPSILVDDLTAAHAAVAAAPAEPSPPAPPAPGASAQAAAPPAPPPPIPPSASAVAAAEAEVAAVREDAVHAFSELEEAFFRAGHDAAPDAPAAAGRADDETFADLDEGYQRPSFWDRLWGRRARRR